MTVDEIRRAVHKVLPRRFSERVELGIDSSGEPAIWVWVIAPGKKLLATDVIFKLDDAVRTAIQRLGEPRWAYVRFRLASEERAERA